LANNDHHNARTTHDTTADKRGANLSKTPSIRSRGFSIPLNASVCLNTTSFLNYQPPASTRLTSPRSPANGHVRFINYSLKQPIASNDELIVNAKSNHLCINTDQYETDENELINESIEFPIVNSFDLRKEVANSCLREVNLKLKYAQIKHIDDSNDENQPVKQERTANEATNEIEPDSNQFLIALKRAQGEQQRHMQEPSASSDYSQVNSPNGNNYKHVSFPPFVILRRFSFLFLFFLI
jgi:hypothetical protein